jgi:hypothetical protein
VSAIYEETRYNFCGQAHPTAGDVERMALPVKAFRKKERARKEANAPFPDSLQLD